ncbi:MAG: hypothetical protein HC917_15195 [Richelia sp. SM2_1_7]|nr:hypothetical protein [Richelia sp. SM2_1_7]
MLRNQSNLQEFDLVEEIKEQAAEKLVAVDTKDSALITKQMVSISPTLLTEQEQNTPVEVQLGQLTVEEQLALTMILAQEESN